jgi:DNA gyrase subunit A
MATSIPPHNLGEVVNALLALIDDPEVTIDGLMEHIPAPDFPTGGILYGIDGVREAYRTGRGPFRSGPAFIEKAKKGDRESIVITEIPYQVNKSVSSSGSRRWCARRSSTRSPTSATSPTATGCAWSWS